MVALFSGMNLETMQTAAVLMNASPMPWTNLIAKHSPMNTPACMMKSVNLWIDKMYVKLKPRESLDWRFIRTQKELW